MGKEIKDLAQLILDYPAREFGKIMVGRSFVFDGDDDNRILIKSYIDDYNYYLKYKENIIDHGWIIYLDHSCEEWIIGNIGEAEKMRDDIEKAIEYMKANP